MVAQSSSVWVETLCGFGRASCLLSAGYARHGRDGKWIEIRHSASVKSLRLNAASLKERQLGIIHL
jgi:hypothetical protein